MKQDENVKFCRFWVDGHNYAGKIRDNSVDIVEGDPFAGMSDVRISFPVDRVKFLAPFTPKKIWAVGLNYKDHLDEFRDMSFEAPAEPVIFTKTMNALCGPSDFIRIPSWAGRIDYEGELAVVIGRKGKNIPVEEALDYVLGYSIMNDVTARELQKSDNQWTRAKSFDTFAPFGPVLLVTKEMPAEAKIQTRLNGKVVQEAVLGQMIFSAAQIIAHISRFATLEAGDVIATGTPRGVGALKPGDVVEIEIDGIGTLRNICGIGD